MIDETSPPGVGRARATLLALRAALPSSLRISVPGVLLLPECVPLSHEQALRHLAQADAAAKPMLYVGFAALGCLAVARWTQAGREAELHEQVVRDELEWLEREVGDHDDLPILLKGMRETLTLPLSELRRWYSQCRLPFIDREVSITPPAVATSGPVAAITFRPPISGLKAKKTQLGRDLEGSGG